MFALIYDFIIESERVILYIRNASDVHHEINQMRIDAHLKHIVMRISKLHKMRIHEVS